MIHAAPYCLPDQVRRQPIQQHAGLSSRYSFCPQHSVQLVHQLHTFRGWARAPSPDDHGSTRQPQATINGRMRRCGQKLGKIHFSKSLQTRRALSQQGATPIAMAQADERPVPQPSLREDASSPTNRGSRLLLQTSYTTGGHQENQESQTPSPLPRINHHTE